MNWLSELVPSASLRRELTLQAFVQDLVPPVLCYFASAVLVQIPRTFTIRLALLPITIWTAFRAGTQLDLVKGYPHEKRLAYVNQQFTLVMTTICMRAVYWTFQQQPHRRTTPKHTGNSESHTMKQLVLDALDLMFSLRGLGWSWFNPRLRLPKETRNVQSKASFILSCLISSLCTMVLSDMAHYFVQSFDPIHLGTAAGGTIFDPTLPPLTRYARSTVITVLVGLVMCFSIETLHNITALSCIVFFGQSPSQWPPISNKPWLSTSLNELWGYRWHQSFRELFGTFGGKPLAYLIGPMGGVMGSFLASGFFHNCGLWGMGRGSDFPRMGGFFVMMGMGVVIERGWKGVTGHRVGGVLGWIWTMCWVIGWGNMLMEAWGLRGLMGSLFVPDAFRIAPLIFGPLATEHRT